MPNIFFRFETLGSFVYKGFESNQPIDAGSVPFCMVGRTRTNIIVLYIHPKNPEPSKVAILRTQNPAIEI